MEQYVTITGTIKMLLSSAHNLDSLAMVSTRNTKFPQFFKLRSKCSPSYMFIFHNR